MDPLDRIIWSADVGSRANLDGVLLDLAGFHADPRLRAIKLDRLFLTDEPLRIIQEVTQWGLKVFVDAKIIEIPSKVEALTRKYVKHKPWMLNCMAGGISNGNLGSDCYAGDQEADGLRRFANICHENDVLPCGVTVLTSKTPEVVRREFHREPLGQVLWYAHKLVDAGFTDIVCSPLEAEHLRQCFTPEELTINCPGIRPAGSDADDQARSNTPKKAIEAGADRLIIGRPITEAKNQRLALKAIIQEIS